MMLTMDAPQSESQWIERARNGDREAFDSLAALHRPRLAALVRGRLGTSLQAAAEVDDVLQETFLRAFGALTRFRPVGEASEDDALFRWLAAISMNVVRELARERPGPEATCAPAETSDAQPAPLTELRRDERFERLRKALKGLPPDYQEVIRLTRFEKLPPDEVARRLGRSRTAARGLLFRALRALKGAFGDTESLSLPPRSLEGED